MSKKQVIEYKQGGHENALLQRDMIVDYAQQLVDEWNATTGTEIQTNDLPTFLTGNEEKLKEFAFEKLSKDNNDTTLFDLKVRKSKAYEMLELPDLKEISLKIRDKHKVLTSYAQIIHIEPEEMEIKAGKVKTIAGFDTKLKNQFIIYAETTEELARLQAFKSLCDSLNELHNNNSIDLRNNHNFEYMVYWNPGALKLEYKTDFIKTGRAW